MFQAQHTKRIHPFLLWISLNLDMLYFSHFTSKALVFFCFLFSYFSLCRPLAWPYSQSDSYSSPLDWMQSILNEVLFFFLYNSSCLLLIIFFSQIRLYSFQCMIVHNLSYMFLNFFLKKSLLYIVLVRFIIFLVKGGIFLLFFPIFDVL